MKMVTVSSIEELYIRSMSYQTSYSSQHKTLDTHVRAKLFSRERVEEERLYKPRARIGLRSGERAGFDATSTTVKSSGHGTSRRSSRTMLQEWSAGAAHTVEAAELF